MIENCLKKLEKDHLRRTRNREVLLEVLHKAKGPLAPPDILQACHALGRKVNKTTIYRDLEALEKVGIVRKVIVSDRKQFFELTERGHHHHFICTTCEKVEDIELDEESLLSRVMTLSKKHRFTILSHAVEFYGQCAHCSK